MYRFRVLNPALSVEFVDFIENVRWPVMNWRERMKWRFWKLSHLGRKPPPAGQSAHGASAKSAPRTPAGFPS